jgi:hypothetical protein
MAPEVISLIYIKDTTGVIRSVNQRYHRRNQKPYIKDTTGVIRSVNQRYHRSNQI